MQSKKSMRQKILLDDAPLNDFIDNDIVYGDHDIDEESEEDEEDDELIVMKELARMCSKKRIILFNLAILNTTHCAHVWRKILLWFQFLAWTLPDLIVVIVSITVVPC